MKLGVLAGETSGDILGAAVLKELSQRIDTPLLQGIGGPRMQEQGLDSLCPMDRLSVMGLVEPLKRLPELLRIRRQVIDQQLAFHPDCFLGIDSPDFNLPIERRLRQQGLRTAHLVSPSVWAWRPGRIRHIAESIDLMLCLLPFEVEVYRRASVPAECVGHPMIDDLAAMPSRQQARSELGLDAQASLVAVLPGSRHTEVSALMPLFLETLQLLQERHPGLRFVIPAANPQRRRQIEDLLGSRDLAVTLVEGRGREAMCASDAVLLASGTATLEAMLIGRPMVIAYRMAWLSWQLLSRLATTRFVGLPNVLADREVVPELLQDAAHPEALAQGVESALERGADIQLPVFAELAEQIGGGFAVRSAEALESLVKAA